MTASMPKLTVVTYHYVRPIAQSAWPNIKGLEVAEFQGQLDYIQRHYTPVGADLLFAHAQGEEPDWPKRPLLLTFDDGYLDHYEYAYQELRKRRLKGAFFAPALSLLDRRLLDVNKVHFVLAAMPNHENLANEIDTHLAELLPRVQIESFRSELAKPSRWDPAETVYVKRVLQRGPDLETRSSIANALFRKYVSSDFSEFAEELYLSPDQAREMIDGGMHFGSHGDQHIWLGHSSESAQQEDLKNSLRIRPALGLKVGEFSICYPYGSYSEKTLALARSFGFSVGFTTEPALNTLNHMTSWLELARIDAGADVPIGKTATLNDWTKQVQY